MYIRTSRMFTSLVKKLMSDRNMSEDIEIGALVNSEYEFKGFVLENGMKVIIIRSEKFKSCGATLTIQIDHRHVPPNLGFVHLLEHVIVYNVNNQDKSNEFGAIIDKYGGNVKASTSFVSSKYFYETQFIYPNLELFVRNIFHPTFDAQSIVAEIENVDSEDVIDSTDDDKCLDDFINAKWFPDEIDKRYGFGGNKYTLQTNLKNDGIDTIEVLEKFHGKDFSTNLMSLIVFAKSTY